jgi:hypothetical protein
VIAMTRRPPARLPPVVSPPDPLASALRSIRRAAAALESGRPREAKDALAKAGRIIVFLHTEAEERSDAAELAGAFRWIARRLKDADLLRDARAARDAERAFVVLVGGLSAQGRDGEDVA